MRTIFLTLIYCIFQVVGLYSQDLENTIEKFKAIKNLCYTATKKEKDLFSDKVYYDTLIAAFDHSENKSLFQIFGTRDADWNDGTKLFRFYIPDSNYRIIDADAFSVFYQTSLPQVIKSLEKNLDNKASVHQQKDSIIAQKHYAHYRIIEFDSLKNEKRVYRHKKILIDKETSLPFYYREDQLGFIDGTDMHLDHFAEYYYSDYELNPVNIELSSVQIPDGFNMEKPEKRLPMLEPGAQAPELDLVDSLGKPFRLHDHRGKIILINFSLVGCPHCIKSIETLNELYASLENEDFEIITIHARDTEEEVKKMNQKFDFKYPIYNNTEDESVNTQNYHVDGYPNFYIIDKEGFILQGFSGYSKSMGEEMVKLIRKNL